MNPQSNPWPEKPANTQGKPAFLQRRISKLWIVNIIGGLSLLAAEILSLTIPNQGSVFWVWAFIFITIIAIIDIFAIAHYWDKTRKNEIQTHPVKKGLSFIVVAFLAFFLTLVAMFIYSLWGIN